MEKKQIKDTYKVEGVGDGKKYVKGKRTNEDALIFFVKKKYRSTFMKFVLSLLGRFIPSEVDGCKTDVIECGEIYELNVHREPYTPIKEGTSGCNAGSSACTTGKRVWHEGKWKALVNRHCMERLNENKPLHRDFWVSPSVFDMGTIENNLAGHNDTWYEVRAENDMDAGLVELTREMDNKLIGKEYDEEIDEVKPGDKIWKEGRTSGYTEGEVLATDVVATVRNGEGTILTYVGQIFTTPFLWGGDSSSFSCKGRKIVGQNFAGSSEISVMTPFKKIKDYFGFEFEKGGTEKQYVAFGRNLYVKPFGKVKTTVRLNLRSKPEVHPDTLIKTLPVGTELEIKDYLGRIDGFHWIEVMSIFGEDEN